MSKLNLLLHLNSYQDSTCSFPSLNNFKWLKDVKGIDVVDPVSKTISLKSGISESILSSIVSINSDITTTYDIALKAGTSNTYRISHNAGTIPNFRTHRVSGDATTVVDVTKNAKLLTFTSSAGTMFSLVTAGVIVGDYARIGTVFNALNRGVFKIISRTATSFTIENETGTAETGILLDTDFIDQVNIYSAAGVQIGNMVEIKAGFSSVTFGNYEITDVAPEYIEFYCTDALPAETNVANAPAFIIYDGSCSFLYVESSAEITISIDDGAPVKIKPMTAGITMINGMFLINSVLKKVVFTAVDDSTITYFIAK
jgi:hypothetical protein